MDRVLSALQQLYFSTDNIQRTEANIWLQKFQTTIDAWTVADAILAAEGVTAIEPLLFAAQTLKTKVAYDVAQLDDASKLSLRNSLIAHVQHQLAISGPRAVLTQLAIALTSLAIQCSEELWPNAIQFFSDTFANNTATLPFFIELITIIPEEFSHCRLISLGVEEFRKRRHELVESNARKIIDFVKYLLGTSTFNKKSLLSCLVLWLRYGSDTIFNEKLELAEIGFKSLLDANLFDPAVDLVCELVAADYEIEKAEKIAKNYYPRLVQLIPYCQNAMNEHSEQVRGYALIFIEAVDSFLTLPIEDFLGYMDILDALLAFTAYFDISIVKLTIGTWNSITQRFLEFEHIHYVEKMEPLRNIFGRLLTVAIKHLEFPLEMTADAQEEHREYRHEVGDVLKDCCQLLGSSASLSFPLQMIKAFMEMPKESLTWQRVESVIFALRTMSSCVDFSESQIMPRLFDAVFRLVCQFSDPTFTRLRYSAVLFFGAYSDWLAQHSSFIIPSVQFICDGLSFANVQAASTLALIHLSESCAEYLIPLLPTLKQVYAQYHISLALNDQLQLTEAIGNIFLAQDRTAFEDVKLFISAFLTSIKNNEITVLMENPQFVSSSLLKFSIFVRQYRESTVNVVDQPPVYLLSLLYETSLFILTNFGTNHEIIDALCQCYGYYLRHTFDYGVDTEKIFAFIEAAFRTSADYTVVSLASATILVYIDNALYGQNCFRMLNTIISFAVQMIEQDLSLADAKLTPLRVAFFRMMGKFINCAPKAFQNTTIIHQIVRLSLPLLRSFDVDELHSILIFIQSSYSNEWSAFTTLIPEYLRALLIRLTQSFRSHLFQNAGALLISLYRWDQESCIRTLSTFINELPPSHFTEPEKTTMLNSFKKAWIESDYRRMKQVVGYFSTNCHRKFE